MLLGLSLRVSWICLLLFSSAAGYPATKADYRYPYTATWGSGGGSAQSPASLGAPLVAADSSPSYEPNKFIVTYDSSSNKPSGAPEVPLQSAGYVSPPVDPLPPVQPQPVGAGHLTKGSVVAAASPTYGLFPFPDPGFAYPAGNTASTSDSGAAAKPYPAAPGSYDVGAGADAYPAAPGSYDVGAGADAYPAAPGSYDVGAGPAYDAPAASYYGYPYGNPSGAVWYEDPAGGADASSDPSSWMPSRSFPDFSVWDTDDSVVPQSVSETSPLPPSSYIIQSRNGYQRAKEVLSHTKYSPEYPEPPPVFAYRAAKAPHKSPKTGSKGGQKV